MQPSDKEFTSVLLGPIDPSVHVRERKKKGLTLVYECLIKKVRSECSVWRTGLIVLLKDNFKARLVTGLRGKGSRKDEAEEDEEKIL